MSDSLVAPDCQGPLPFYADHVGSLLRPANLKQARNDYSKGQLSASQLRELEDSEIKKAVAGQYNTGLRSLTDGELRRAWWHFDFLKGLDGVELYQTEGGYKFHGVETKAENLRITGKVSFNSNHPFLEDFKFLKGVVDNYPDAIAKQTIPSPNMLMHLKIRNNPHYSDFADYVQDLGNAYADAIKAFYAAGCRYLQLDDVFWAYLADAATPAKEEAAGFTLEQVVDACVDTLNIALADKPADMVVSMHVCRGNFSSTWIYQGGYEQVEDALARLENLDGLFLEYDDARSGDFAPLAKIKNAQIVLGVITSKHGELEPAEEVINRIKEASQYVPLDRLALSPQCGFASTEEGNKVTAEQQWAKLEHVVSIANQVWNR